MLIRSNHTAALHGLIAPQGEAKKKRLAERGTFEWLCNEYFSSGEFKQLDSRTQLLRRRALNSVCEVHGEKPYKLVEPIHIRKLRDEKAEKPETANSLLKTLRQLFHFASQYGYASNNPARDVPYFKKKGDGFHTWSEAEIKQFEDTHPIGSRALLAMSLMLYLGQRRSDAIRLGRQHMKDGRIEFTQHKNRARNPVTLSIPIHPRLKEIIDATPKKGLMLITRENGQPFTDAGFGNRFRKWCDEAGLTQCSAHGLRKAAATRLAHAGASEHEIMAITGHKSSKQVSVYTKGVNQVRLSDTVIAKQVAADLQREIVPLTDQLENGGTNKLAKRLK